MLVYNQIAKAESLWPEPIERVWQTKNGERERSELARELAKKMPQLNLGDIFFLAGIVNTEERPHGTITWIADFYDISRVSVYELGDRVVEWLTKPIGEQVIPELIETKGGERINFDRTILTALFPGNASIRPTQEILQEAFGDQKSVGYISQLRSEAGRRAGAALTAINYEPMGPVIALRDETFFQGRPMLLLVDPVSSTIISAQVCADRKADTWAIILMMAEEQGVSLAGLTEDMAKMYGKSLKLAEMSEKPQQKDIWHLERDGTRMRRILERSAYRAMQEVVSVEKKLTKEWDAEVFEKEYLPAIVKETQTIEQHDNFEIWLDHFQDALALVDIRSGEIREADTAQWFLEEVITAMEQIEHVRVRKFAKTLRNHQPQLLTFLAWTETAVTDFDARLAALIPDEHLRSQFIRTVARSWLLNQAIINGHRQWKPEALNAAASVDTRIAAYPQLAAFASALRQILDASGRTSSIVESINSLLKSFIKNRKGFKNQQSMQAFLNLFVLWHNMRVYHPRCKRGGFSPFQLAGIDPGCADWLSLLDYLPTA